MNRFFYHYNKSKGAMTIHFKGTCSIVNNIECLVPCETKWSNTQPRLKMQGFANNVIIEDNKAVIL